ncbi:hypothetical protein AVEN_5332-1 [Araneus ventricosus]|uniref:Uncharacterized protein n=1 Tax=Araneus ventricosus TaxID=182803 RepID=A0A4Y2K4V9_ARAVE|nr:hypothetical protein AVEN_5332-1 [Araneus ventricosus]
MKRLSSGKVWASARGIQVRNPIPVKLRRIVGLLTHIVLIRLLICRVLCIFLQDTRTRKKKLPEREQETSKTRKKNFQNENKRLPEHEQEFSRTRKIDSQNENKRLPKRKQQTSRTRTKDFQNKNKSFPEREKDTSKSRTRDLDSSDLYHYMVQIHPLAISLWKTLRILLSSTCLLRPFNIRQKSARILMISYADNVRNVLSVSALNAFRNILAFRKFSLNYGKDSYCLLNFLICRVLLLPNTRQ